MLLLDAFRAGIAGVDPETVTAGVVEQLDFSGSRRVVVIAAGKASVAMARGVDRAADSVDGVIVAPAPADAPFPVIVGGHPTPTEGSVAGARQALDLARSAGSDDVVVCLISGGASALLAAPAGGLSVEDLQRTNRTLLECGADIVETNTVRKHLSAIKGGRLAAAAERSRLVTLVLSDIVGNPLDAIGSGPTVPDPTTYEDALAVVDRYGLHDHLLEGVVGHLERGRAGQIPETPIHSHPRHEIEIVGSGAVAAEAAATFIRSKGVRARVVSTRHIGEAREAAVSAVLTPSDAGEVLVFAGETTVTVAGSGSGGRNQEAALAAAIEIDGRPITFLAGGTDGVDGPTDAAGGIVDGRTIDRGRAMGIDATGSLRNNDAGTYLATTDDLVVTGPTGTNVADLWFVLSREIRDV
jgi:hydroxypyruvate reductase